MRNMERLEELTHRPPRQFGVWIVAGLMATVLFAAIAGSLSEEVATEEKDPLESFGHAASLAGLAPRITAESKPAPEVDRKSLVFPEVLAGAVLPPDDLSADSRPEVEAAIAAAAAELRHPDPLTEPTTLSEIAAPAATMATQSPSTEKLAASADLHLPASEDAQAQPRSARATTGHDGKYTLQVVSYQSSSESNLFAEELRSRGHEAFVQRADIEGRGTFYRVRIGPFDSKGEAQRYRAEFEAQEHMNTFVVKRRD